VFFKKVLLFLIEGKRSGEEKEEKKKMKFKGVFFNP